MKKPAPKKKSSEQCASTACYGALRCVLPALDALGREHAVHSTSKPGGKPPEHATWQAVADGRVKVVAYKRGKRTSELFEGESEPAPNLKPCAAIDARGFACSKVAGHLGDHSNASGWEIAAVCGARWDHTNGGKRLMKAPHLACERVEGHDGDHRAYSDNHVGEWAGNGSGGGAWIPKTRYEGRTLDEGELPHALTLEDEPIDDQDAEASIADEPDDVDMRVLARQQREEREAHAAELAKAPALTDACVKCGRELGEHDGKKCPKPAKVPKIVAPTATQAEAVTGPLILGYPRHPAAVLFQLLEGEPLQALADSIAAHGQRDPIVLVTVGEKTYILDGSNRGIACEMRGIKPRFVHYEGPKDLQSLIDYSMDKNKHRRHQEPSVLAMVAVDAGQLLGRGNPGDRETGRSAGLMTQAEAGKKLGVSERLVRRAKVVHDKGTPKLNEAVRKGRMAVDAAEQVAKLPTAKQDELADQALAKKGGTIRTGRIRALVRQEEKRAVVRKINEGRVMPMPMGPFGVIYADYPWLYENSDQHEGSRGHMNYPPMTMEEIVEHARSTAVRAAKDCVLALWVTNLYAPEVKQVIAAFGAEHRTMWTWPKPRAGVGTWGRGQTEHLIIASIGTPVHTLNEISTLLESYPPEHPGEHSSKPREVADLLNKHCGGPFLELFGRDEREGWAVWGAEPRKFAAA